MPGMDASTQERWKAETVIDILNRWGLAAAAPGRRDLRYGRPVFDQLAQRAKFRVLPMPQDAGSEVEALSRALIELAAKAIALAQPQSAADLTRMLAGNEDPLRLAYVLASIFSLDSAREQALLEAETRVDALRLMHAYLAHELQVLELRQKIASNGPRIGQSPIRLNSRNVTSERTSLDISRHGTPSSTTGRVQRERRADGIACASASS